MDTVPIAAERPTMRLAEVAPILGIGRSAAYAAAQRGEIPVIRLGGRLVVPTARLRAMLGLDDATA